jgi:very-long-chain (3R)-3-hydroxyacyl-CoA dehydratase
MSFIPTFSKKQVKKRHKLQKPNRDNNATFKNIATFKIMNNTIKYYLAGYNLTAFIFWLAYLIVFAGSGFMLSRPGLILLNIAQGLALLEILHTIFKWVKSPVLSTAAQVFSRILVVVLIDYFTYSYGPLWPITKNGILIVTIAWGITELVRYSFYLLSLFDKQPKWLLWMRYTFFIVLYPLGVTGEWLIIITPLFMFFSLRLYTVMLVVLAISYLYYFPVLYMYMWKQRKARLGPIPSQYKA